jgi:hypothetical protein
VLGVAVYGAFADTSKDPKAPEGIHFMHGNHKDPLAKIGIDVDDPAQCKTCHTLDATGAVRAPAAQGHAPCMRSGCHASDFMVISEAGKKTRPQEFQRASQFCTGCHPTVPWPWKKPQTLTIQAWRNQREHHIEMGGNEGEGTRGMDHFGHITLAKKKDGSATQCRDCHVTDASFKLQAGAPGHKQCMQCHTGGAVFAMQECGRCHKKGGREGWLRGVLERARIKINEDDIHGSRPKTTVRACESEGAAKADKQFKGKNPKAKCFKHETPGHHLTNDKKDVQCAQCHHMIGDKSSWAGRSYGSIADLHTNKIIGAAGKEVVTSKGCGGADKNDAQHAACSGGNACHRHAKEVDLDCPTGERNCALCHAQRTNNEAF